MAEFKKEQDIRFEHLLELFPERELPVTLDASSKHELGQDLEPLANEMVQRFLLQEDDSEADNYTEFLACFRLPQAEKFHALLYWRADLLGDRYTLITFNNQGICIDKKELAGTKYEAGKVIQIDATIEEDWYIHLNKKAAGMELGAEKESLPESRFQLSVEGEIVDLN